MNKISLLKGFAAFALVGLFGTSAIALSGHFEKSPLSANASATYPSAPETSTPLTDGCAFNYLYFASDAAYQITNGQTAFNLYPCHGGEPLNFFAVSEEVSGIWLVDILAVEKADLDAAADTSNLTATGNYYYFGYNNRSLATYNQGAVVKFNSLVFADEVATTRYPAAARDYGTYIQNYKVPLTNGQKFSSLYIGNPNFENSSFVWGFGYIEPSENGNELETLIIIYGTETTSDSRWGMTIRKAYSETLFLNISGCTSNTGDYYFGNRINTPNASKYVRLYARETLNFTIRSGHEYIWDLDAIKDSVFIPYDDPYLVGYRAAYDAGYSAGYDAGADEGRQEGFSEGWDEGHLDGYNEGYAAGYAAGKAYKPEAVDLELPSNWYPSQFVTYVTFWNYPRMPETDANDVWFLLGSDDRNLAASQDVGTWNFYTDFEGRTTLYDGLYVHYKKFSGTGYYLISADGQTQNVSTILGEDETQYFIEGIYIRKTTDALTTPTAQSIPYNCIAKAKIGNVDGHNVVYDQLEWVSDDYRSMHITAQTANTSSGYKWRGSIYTKVETPERWTWLECDYAEAIKATGVSKVTSFAAQQDNAFNLLSSAFSSVASIMNIAILPYITLGTLIFIPLIVTIIVAVVKLLGK